MISAHNRADRLLFLFQPSHTTSLVMSCCHDANWRYRNTRRGRATATLRYRCEYNLARCIHAISETLPRRRHRTVLHISIQENCRLRIRHQKLQDLRVGSNVLPIRLFADDSDGQTGATDSWARRTVRNLIRHPGIPTRSSTQSDSVGRNRLEWARSNEWDSESAPAGSCDVPVGGGQHAREDEPVKSQK